MSEINDDDSKRIKKAFYESENYFDLGDAVTDVQFASGGQEKLSAFAKLAGKAVFNVGLFAGKTGLHVGVEIINRSPGILAGVAEQRLKEGRHNLTDEQVKKTEEFIERNKGRKLSKESK
ncbi:hypothetical protein [Pseudomonas paralcaligenes]|uniref:hypothetical protein n=1 Tax=Pseudomonas paralcaligenes TaxID=2772558 RepID=UPI001C7EB038|nr:hypothetical protein [Pseudomonas paralcaligenes]